MMIGDIGQAFVEGRVSVRRVSGLCVLRCTPPAPRASLCPRAGSCGMFSRAASGYALQVPLEALHNGVLWSALHTSTNQRCNVRVLDKEAPRIEVVRVCVSICVCVCVSVCRCVAPL